MTSGTCSEAARRPGGGRSEFQLLVDDLLLRAGNGDAGAFAVLYGMTSARVLGVCRQLVCNAADAEDIAQEAYLEIWAKATTFDPRRGVGTGWIMTIAHHRAVDRVRSIESARRRDTAYARGDHRRPGDEAVERMLAAADVDEIRTAITGLSGVRREALAYAFFTDHTYVQASSMLGIPLGTFKSRVRDAVRALRSVLAGAC